MNNSTNVPFFARKATEKGLNVRSGVKAGLREHTVKLREEDSK